jgi:hypothetical protein
MNKLDLLFDAKQFGLAFGAATGDSSCVLKESRPEATAHSEGEAASVGARWPQDGGQKVVHDVQLRRKEK